MELSRRPPRWSWAIVGIAIAVLALSFVPGWLTHHRELQGEGYRSLVIGPTAWQLRSGSLPVIGAGVAVAVVAGLLAVGVRRARGWLVVALAAALGLLAAGLVPIAQTGHISRVWISPGWTLLVAVVAVAVMAVIAWRGAQPSTRGALVAAALFLVVAAGGAGARALQLELTEGATQHWSDGSWARADEGTELVLELRGSTFVLGPWSGEVEAAGINAIITGDPACPEARGFYRVRSAGGDDVLWEKIVDVCADGARAADLEGVWRPATDADS